MVDYKPETKAVHAGRVIDAATGAVAPPLHMSTTFEREADGTYPRGYSYGTFDNPNRAWLEQAAAELEGGACAMATSCGMAAIACVLSVLKSGERVIVSHEVFQGTGRFMRTQLQQWGISTDVVDTTNLQEIEDAIQPSTKMIWFDTPSNPLVRVTDIAAVAKLAKPRGILVGVDSTFATWVLQRPLELGADAVVYAATKYISGHTDVVNGLAIFRDEETIYNHARSFQINLGMVPSPFDCWMVHRSLRTLPLRMRAHSENALAVAKFMQEHPRVKRVYYPGLPGCQGHEVAKRQMSNGFGGMMSVSVKGGRDAAIETAARAKLFTRAASLGGPESLIEHRASSPIQTLGEGTGFETPDDLLRLSIGIENADDLISDLDQALHGNWTP